MNQPELQRRRQELEQQYLSIENAWSERGFEIYEEFGHLSEEEDHLRSWANGRKQIHGREDPIVIVTLTQAIRICQNMGLSKRAIRRLHLGTGMQDDAVRTLAAQHLKLAERRRIPPDKQHSKDPAK
jgi:hypothetical protein